MSEPIGEVNSVVTLSIQLSLEIATLINHLEPFLPRESKFPRPQTSNLGRIAKKKEKTNKRKSNTEGAEEK